MCTSNPIYRFRFSSIGVYSDCRWQSLPAKGRARLFFREHRITHRCGLWLLPFPVYRIRTGQPNTRAGLFHIFAELPMHVSAGPLRSVPGYAFPFTKQTEHTQKRARLQSVDCAFMLTPDKWDSAAFSSIFLAWSFFCSQAFSQPAHLRVTQTVETVEKGGGF